MKVLAFFAHPDDETMFFGGTLALLAKSNVDVDYLCATRGEGGEVGEPPVCTSDELGLVRERELACAVKALGGHSLEFLDYLDPPEGPDGDLYPYADNQDEVAEKLIQVIRRIKPDTVITHGMNGEYGHPAHLLNYQAAIRAFSSLGDEASYLYSVSANFPGHPKPRHINQDQNAHLVLDVRSTLEQKIQAAMCHRSQHALFVRRASEDAGRQVTVPETLLDVESLHRVHPTVRGQIDDRLTEILTPWVVEVRGSV
jgi:LmbE family N-acetylglucosaminyl deacetylase